MRNEVYMRLFYAKMWIKKYLYYNHAKYDEDILKLNTWRAIVNLSHRVYKTHGLRGHDGRQKIRKVLWAYALKELHRYHHPSLLDRIVNYLRTAIAK